jgi:hypothetical protein
VGKNSEKIGGDFLKRFFSWGNFAGESLKNFWEIFGARIIFLNFLRFQEFLYFLDFQNFVRRGIRPPFRS